MNEGNWIDLGAGGSPPHVLSKTSAHLLVSKSPLHARMRKTGEHEDDTTDDMDLGSIVHAMVLGAGKKIVVLDHDNYRTKAAKQARDDARAQGAIPILRAKEEVTAGLARRLKRNIEAHGFALDGVSEPGVSWFERTTDGSDEDVECLGALDHWHPRTATIFDLKIARSGHPDACRKHLFAFGCDIQAAAYTSAVEKIHPELQGRTRFVFLFCELFTGAVTPVTLSGDFRRLGEQRWQRAVNTWARCLREDRWPGYTTGPITIDAPEWAMAAEMTAQHDANEQSFQTGNHDEGDDDE